jgi:hypothetical protein
MLGGAILYLLGCRDTSLPPEWSPSVVLQDTLTQQVTQGVTLSLVGFKDSYTFDEPIVGYLNLKNNSDPNPLPLYFYGSPPHRVIVYPLDSREFVYYFPGAIGYSEWADTLRTGDSLRYEISWPQTTWDSKDLSLTSLKAFPGTYRIFVYMGGSPLLNKVLTKFVRITTRGDPLSAWLRVDYSSEDTVKADFIVRNRTRSSVIIGTTARQPMTVAFLRGRDTVLTMKYSMPWRTLRLEGGSDNVIYPFRVSKSDSAFASLQGFFNMTFILHLNSRDLIASGIR